MAYIEIALVVVAIWVAVAFAVSVLVGTAFRLANSGRAPDVFDDMKKAPGSGYRAAP